MLVAIIIVLLFWTLWFAGPYIRRWLMRRGVNYMQDRMYRSMGIDPARMKQARREAEKEAKASSSGRGHGRRKRWRGHTGKTIPADYGEAVSFEVLPVIGSEKWLTDTDKSPVYTEYRKETQITEAQYVIIN